MIRFYITFERCEKFLFITPKTKSAWHGKSSYIYRLNP